MAYPTNTMIRPRELAWQDNGELSVNLLYDIPGGVLLKNAATAWNAMHDAAVDAGITLAPTSALDTYRPLGTQERIFLERYTTTWRPFAERKFWRGKWWYKKLGKATAAVPGTSNHGWALAVDVANASGARLQWLLRNATTYGFWWEIQSEPWHIRYCLGDLLPAILDDGHAQPSHPSLPPPPPPPTSDVDIYEETDVSTTIHKPVRRLGTPDADPVFDFPTLNVHGKVLGGMVCHSYLVIFQAQAGTEKIITVFAGGEPRPVPLPSDGSAWVFPVWKEGFASVGSHSPAFATQNADGVICEARELWLPNR